MNMYNYKFIDMVNKKYDRETCACQEPERYLLSLSYYYTGFQVVHKDTE